MTETKKQREELLKNFNYVAEMSYNLVCQANDSTDPDERKHKFNDAAKLLEARAEIAAGIIARGDSVSGKTLEAIDDALLGSFNFTSHWGADYKCDGKNEFLLAHVKIANTFLSMEKYYSDTFRLEQVERWLSITLKDVREWEKDRQKEHPAVNEFTITKAKILATRAAATKAIAHKKHALSLDQSFPLPENGPKIRKEELRW